MSFVTFICISDSISDAHQFRSSRRRPVVEEKQAAS